MLRWLPAVWIWRWLVMISKCVLYVYVAPMARKPGNASRNVATSCVVIVVKTTLTVTQQNQFTREALGPHQEAGRELERWSDDGQWGMGTIPRRKPEIKKPSGCCLYNKHKSHASARKSFYCTWRWKKRDHHVFTPLLPPVQMNHPSPNFKHTSVDFSLFEALGYQVWARGAFPGRGSQLIGKRA